MFFQSYAYEAQVCVFWTFSTDPVRHMNALLIQVRTFGKKQVLAADCQIQARVSRAAERSTGAV